MIVFYNGKYHDLDKGTLRVSKDDAEYLKGVYQQFEKPEAAAALELFRGYCAAGDPVAHADPNLSHAQKWRELPYLRLLNDIELGKRLSAKKPLNITVEKTKEEQNERRDYDYGGGGPLNFTPGG